MGESVTEGTISRWLKAVGDPVTEGESLVEVTTDKVDVEVPSPAAGTLESITAQEGDTVNVGATLATIASGTNGTATANCGECGSKSDFKHTAPVGSFQPNRFGLYDMVGNIFEWTENCYHPSYERPARLVQCPARGKVLPTSRAIDWRVYGLMSPIGSAPRSANARR